MLNNIDRLMWNEKSRCCYFHLNDQAPECPRLAHTDVGWNQLGFSSRTCRWWWRCYCLHNTIHNWSTFGVAHLPLMCRSPVLPLSIYHSFSLDSHCGLKTWAHKLASALDWVWWSNWIVWCIQTSQVESITRQNVFDLNIHIGEEGQSSIWKIKYIFRVTRSTLTTCVLGHANHSTHAHTHSVFICHYTCCIEILTEIFEKRLKMEMTPAHTNTQRWWG